MRTHSPPFHQKETTVRLSALSIWNWQRASRYSQRQRNSILSEVDFAPNRLVPQQDMRGFSLVELVIVASVIFVVAGFALTQITRARQALVRNNATRELTSYIEKARRDSIRRHSTTASQMAGVTLLTSSSYSVTLDSDGDGAMDADRVINLPANSNLSFSGNFPRSVRFDWRGRTADSSGIAATPADITISNSYGASTINISRAGQSEVDVAPTTDPISNSTAPSVTFRDQTQLP